MQTTHNPFKQAIRAPGTRIGLWAGIGNPYVTEILASTGYDWILIDGEHGPNDLHTILGQLQTMARYPAVAPVVRPPVGDAIRLKQLLDIGVQNFLIPMVDTAAQAQALVAATRYAPQGMRGIAPALARAAQWGQIPDYMKHANDEICLLVQAESVTALDNLDAIVDVDGVDGVFFGPADLAASMGHIHEPAHPEVRRVVEDGIKRVLSKGKAAGIITGDDDFTRRSIELGAQVVAVAVDTLLLIDAAKQRLRSFR